MSRAKSLSIEHELEASRKQWLQAWPETVEWLKTNGAHVNSHLSARQTSTARSVVASAPMRYGDTLLVVPKKLWIHLDNFPTFKDSAGPPKGSPSDVNLLKLAAALASETKKGSRSTWEPYLRRLPTRSDFHAFHPQLADTQLLSDFGALRTARLMHTLRGVDKRLSETFALWQKVHARPREIDRLEWDDIHEALMRLRTRRFSVEGGQSALIPGVDLMNTAVGTRLNTRWVPDWESGFAVSTTRPLNNSEELFLDYCSDCDNNKLVATWGVYQEDNPNKLDMKHAPDCLSMRNQLSAQSVTLREVAETMLEISADEAAPMAESTSQAPVPRCKPDLVESDDQGLIRCSLARLAWEYCGDSWRTLPLQA